MLHVVGNMKRIDVSEKIHTYTYDEAVELTGHGRYNHIVLTACSIISNAVALDMFGYSIVVAASSCDLRLGLAETGILASVPFAGVIFALPWGYYADAQGRRRSLLLSTTFGFLFATLSSFSPTWEYMLVLKLIGCCFSVASFTLTMTYLGECTGSRNRGRYLFIMNSMNLASELISFALAYFILPLTFKVPLSWLGITYRSWRLLTLVLALPLGVGALIMMFLHESPKFLANKGNKDEALEVLRKMYVRNGGRSQEYPVRSLIDEASDNNNSLCNVVWSRTMPLFKPPMLWKTLQLFYLMAICCSTNNVFLMWYPMIVNIFFISLSGEWSSDKSFCERIVDNSTFTDISDNTCDDTISPNTIYSGMLYGLFFCVLNLAVSPLASWRRVVLISVLLVSSVCGILVDFVKEPVVNMILFTLLQSTVVGIAIVASYFVDLYPTSSRGLVTSLGVMVARLVSLGGVNLIGGIINDYCRKTFIGWSMFVLSGVLVSLFLPTDKNTRK